MNLRDFPSVKTRRIALEKELSVNLTHIGSGTLDENLAGTRNCENMIGVAQVPIGVAGPLEISHQLSDFSYQHKTYYIPLATTEGALVASVNRGCKAITENGGAIVHSHRLGATRGPVFKVKNIEENTKLDVFLDTHLPQFQQIAEKTSAHIKLKNVDFKSVGKYRYVRFIFDTQDAMGLNMVTIATEPIVRFIEAKTGAQCISLSGNFCVDKKPSWQNFLNNRGIIVWGEITISGEILERVLKTSARKVYEVWLAKCLLGSIMSGSMGYNAQFANIIAAIFLAAGQDIAHVVEGSLGITTADVVNEKDLYISIYLPDLMVGTVGGGTGLATQQEALTMLGVAGGKNGAHAQRFAEIIAGAILAGELSLLSSLEEGTLAKAHQSLARGRVNTTNSTNTTNPTNKKAIHL